MPETPVFERLERAVCLIARHPFYPGKREAVEDCLDDLEERYREGVLTEDEKTRLVAILDSADAPEHAGRRRVSGANDLP